MNIYNTATQYINAAKKDNINPNHYTFGGIETIEYLKAKLTPEEFRGFLKGKCIEICIKRS